jgi:hypothetical protein
MLESPTMVEWLREISPTKHPTYIPNASLDALYSSLIATGRNVDVQGCKEVRSSFT